MDDEGYLSKSAIMDILESLEDGVREELREKEALYDHVKLNLDAVDEGLIRLDGQLDMIKLAKTHLQKILTLAIQDEDLDL